VTPERLSAWLAAFDVALRSVGLREEHPPLPRLRRRLQALDPARTGDLFLPAEISPRSGMPAASWWGRPLAEARAGGGPDDAGRAAALDAALGRRVAARTFVRGLLADDAAAPRLTARVRRAPSEIVVTLDLALADDRQARLGVVLTTGPDGPFSVSAGAVRAEPEVEDTLARLAGLETAGIEAILTERWRARIAQVSRGVVGPAWFPGIAVPDGAPSGLSAGFALCATTEVRGAGADQYDARWAANRAALPGVTAWVRATDRRAVIRPI
jgi:hypothetical protein